MNWHYYLSIFITFLIVLFIYEKRSKRGKRLDDKTIDKNMNEYKNEFWRSNIK